MVVNELSAAPDIHVPVAVPQLIERAPKVAAASVFIQLLVGLPAATWFPVTV